MLEFIKSQKDQMAYVVQAGCWDPLVRWDLWVQSDSQNHLVGLVQLVHLVQKVHLVHKVLVVGKVYWVDKVVCMVHSGHWVHRDYLVHKLVDMTRAYLSEN